MHSRAWIPVLAAMGVGAALSATLAVIYFFDPSISPYYPKCLFYQATGWRCPGCGSTRATHHLLHGNLGTAFYYNCMFVSVLPIGCWLAARGLWRTWRSAPPAPWHWRRTTWLAAFSIAALLVFWLVRNLPGWPLL